jgi:hypothetical protein
LFRSCWVPSHLRLDLGLSSRIALWTNFTKVTGERISTAADGVIQIPVTIPAILASFYCGANFRPPDRSQFAAIGPCGQLTKLSIEWLLALTLLFNPIALLVVLARPQKTVCYVAKVLILSKLGRERVLAKSPRGLRNTVLQKERRLAQIMLPAL